MSHSSEFPQGEGSSNPKNEEKPSFKRPEFVLIDERDGRSQYTHFGVDSSRRPQDSTYQENGQSVGSSPISLRFICLLGFIFCLVFGIGILLWTIVLTALAMISLFQNKGLNQGMWNFWKIWANTAIAGFGFTLGMINPTLGLGLLAIYFSLASHIVGEDLLRTVIRRSFNHF